MKFQNKYLAVIAYANGFTLWHYRDMKTKISEINDEYFGQIHNLCSSGDKIMLSLQDGYMEVIVSGIGGKYPNKIVYLKTLTKIEFVSEGCTDE